MKVSMSHAPVARVARLASVVAATSAIFLLLTAACARGEAIDEAAMPLTSAAEGAVPTEQAPAPAPAEAPAPVETPEPEIAIEAAGEVVEGAGTAVKSEAATSTASAASGAVREAASEAVRRATEATSEVGQVATSTVAAVGDRAQQLSGLSEEAGTKVAAVAGLGDPPRPVRLAQRAGTPPSGALTSPGESHISLDKAPHTDGAVQLIGVLPRMHAGGGVSSSAAEYRGFSGAVSSWLGAFESHNGIQSTPADSTTSGRSSDPAPLDGPTPAPGSSGAAAGSTGSSFVPLAALLALLALVAPATLRRLREVPASRPPTPFVCALERPG